MVWEHLQLMITFGDQQGLVKQVVQVHYASDPPHIRSEVLAREQAYDDVERVMNQLREGFQDRIARLGVDGWEMVAFVTSQSGGIDTSWQAWFKRPAAR